MDYPKSLDKSFFHEKKRWIDKSNEEFLRFSPKNPLVTASWASRKPWWAPRELVGLRSKIKWNLLKIIENRRFVTSKWNLLRIGFPLADLERVWDWGCLGELFGKTATLAPPFSSLWRCFLNTMLAPGMLTKSCAPEHPCSLLGCWPLRVTPKGPSFPAMEKLRCSSYTHFFKLLWRQKLNFHNSFEKPKG